MSWFAVTSSGSRDVTLARAVRSPGVGPAAAVVISIASNSAGDDDCRDEALS